MSGGNALGRQSIDRVVFPALDQRQAFESETAFRNMPGGRIRHIGTSPVRRRSGAVAQKLF